MPYSKNSSALIKSWFEESLKLKPGEELYIPCDTKSKQTNLKTSLYGARKEYANIDPVQAESITFSPVIRETEVEGKPISMPYIRVYKSQVEANKGFKKMADGSIKEITINADKDRTRKILDLIKEGADRKKIEEIVENLSDDELKLINTDKE